MKSHRSLGIVIKLGTSSIVDEKTHQPLLSNLSLIVETAHKLREDGHRVVIVSSGAIGVGLRRMEKEKRPKHLAQLQALAAIGQCRLMNIWDSLFNHLKQPVAQILLTRNDIADRSRYLNAQRTFNELLDMGVIPIVNENDTLAVSEIKFGDNDTLSAITAAMVHADLLFLMTDVDCLYDKNPRTHPDAQPIEVVEDIGALQADVSSAGSSLGTGGMSTKIVAARLATSAGVTTVITRASNPGNISRIAQHIQASRSPASLLTRENGDVNAAADDTEDPLARSTASLQSLDVAARPQKQSQTVPLHTRFLPSPQPIRDRSFWILHGLKPHGDVYIDQGCYKALLNKAGLLPVGVVDLDGTFSGHECVRLLVVERNNTTTGASADGKLWHGEPLDVGRAIVNFSSAEIIRIKGHQSKEIEGLLGYADSGYVAEREHVTFFRRESRPQTPTPMGPGTATPVVGVAEYESKGAVP
ncbi:glutamate 5-kinase [Cryphonectria parasitica EP155]|uniref:Glutamate 5-kinase n=1 Tax=Cryphonectria parasitica (strain ATCC 38755 / EP155) TaxID=660469 RepID=A0A9P4YAS3_CRYP1|nr:glutamate 5-kinase [Cryphonectria parasitica EP155]KAF3769601.1 glutamate 5-kinase [Cryphonectria parasitica EP155]